MTGLVSLHVGIVLFAVDAISPYLPFDQSHFLQNGILRSSPWRPHPPSPRRTSFLRESSAAFLAKSLLIFSILWSSSSNNASCRGDSRIDGGKSLPQNSHFPYRRLKT